MPIILCLLKSRSLIVVRRKLGIKTLKNTESNSYVIKYLVEAFTSISKKYHSQDCNVAHHVLAKSIKSKRTIQRHLIKWTSEIVNLHQKNIKRNSFRRDSLDIEGQMNKLWEFSGRLPCKDMKLVVVKGLVHAFWHDNTRPSSNAKDVLKCYRGSRHHEPHIKHYIGMTQPQLYEMFKVSHPNWGLVKDLLKSENHGMLESTPSVTSTVVDII